MLRKNSVLLIFLVILCVSSTVFAQESAPPALTIGPVNVASESNSQPESPAQTGPANQTTVQATITITQPAQGQPTAPAQPAAEPQVTQTIQHEGIALVMLSSERRNDFSEALEFELAARRMRVELADPPEGDTAIARALTAQRAAQRTNADVAVWIEQAPATQTEMGTLVRAVGPQSQESRHALLPNEYHSVEPRTFALITLSLIDELVAPPYIPYAPELPEQPPQPEVVIPPPDPVIPEIPAVGPQLQTRIIGGDFVPYVGTSLIHRGTERRMLSLNILGGLSGSIGAFGFAGLFNTNLHDSRGVVTAGLFNLNRAGGSTGIQAAGIFNMANGEVRGLQSAGVFNLSTGNVRGAQRSGVVNIAHGNVDGFQSAGVFNFVTGDLHGHHHSGVLNIVRGSAVGSQFAGVYNQVIGDLHGLQTSGVLNIARDVRGTQLTGVANIAGRVDGAQLGVVNIAREEVDGVQLGLVNVADNSDFSLGLINIIPGGRYHIDVHGEENGFIRASFKHGGRYFHNIYSIGAQVQDGDLSIGAGFGGHIPIRSRLFVDIDLMFYQIVFLREGDNAISDNPGPRTYQWDLNLHSQLKIVLGIQLLRWLALTVGISYNIHVTDRYDAASNGSSSPYALLFEQTFERSRGEGDAGVYGWPGITLGLQFLSDRRDR